MNKRSFDDMAEIEEVRANIRTFKAQLLAAETDININKYEKILRLEYERLAQLEKQAAGE